MFFFSLSIGKNEHLLADGDALNATSFHFPEGSVHFVLESINEKILG